MIIDITFLFFNIMVILLFVHHNHCFLLVLSIYFVPELLLLRNDVNNRHSILGHFISFIVLDKTMH